MIIRIEGQRKQMTDGQMTDRQMTDGQMTDEQTDRHIDRQTNR
jgi:hypothetical protein